MDIKELLNKEKLTDAERGQLMQAIAANADLRRAYIESRAFVLEPLIQKESQVRNIFQVENLAIGAQPYYPIGSKEVQTAWVAAGVGNAPRRQIEGDEVYAPLFALQGRVEWNMMLAEQARFSIADEQNFYMVEQLKELENAVGWNLIKAAAADTTFAANNSVQIGSGTGVDLTTGQGYFSKQLFSELMYSADIARRQITDIYVSPRTMFDIFNYWGVTNAVGGTAGSISVVPNIPDGAATQIYNQGPPGSGTSNTEYVLTLWGVRFHKVYNSAIVGDEAVYAFDLSNQRSRFGAMPIRRRLVTYEDPIAITEWKIGYFGRMELGFVILDSTNLFVGTIDRA